MSWLSVAVPLATLLGVTFLDGCIQNIGVPPGTLTTIAEAILSIYIIWRLKPRLTGTFKYLLLVPVGFCFGDLAYGFNHYIIRKAYLNSVGPLSYAVPYVLGLSAALWFLHRLGKQPRESKYVLLIGYVLSVAVFALNVQAIVIPALFHKSPPLPPVIAAFTVAFSVLESALVGLSAILLILSSSTVVQTLLFGLLALTISDIALRYQSVYQNLLGMTIFENGWFFGLALITIGVNFLSGLKESEVREQFTQFMRFYSIRAMTAGYVLLGLCSVWLALSFYFKSLHIPNELSGSLLIALAIFGFSILVANAVDRSLSLITFKLAEERPLQRREFPRQLPQEIRTIVEYFQRLNGKITSERDHTLALSSKMAHNIQSPIQALGMAKYALSLHVKKTNISGKDLEEQLKLIDVSSKAITDIAGHLLEEKRRLIGQETVSTSVNKAVTLATANFPHHEIHVEASPMAETTPASGLTEVITNLVNNAAEASEPGLPIVVRAVTEGERMTVSVMDRGTGISKSTLSQLRAGKGITTKRHGHGIGISLNV